jgi:hypothetical protein
MQVTIFTQIRGSHKDGYKENRLLECHRVVLQRGTIVSEKHAAPIFRTKDRRKWKLPQILWYLSLRLHCVKFQNTIIYDLIQG